MHACMHACLCCLDLENDELGGVFIYFYWTKWSFCNFISLYFSIAKYATFFPNHSHTETIVLYKPQSHIYHFFLYKPQSHKDLYFIKTTVTYIPLFYTNHSHTDTFVLYKPQSHIYHCFIQTTVTLRSLFLYKPQSYRYHCFMQTCIKDHARIKY